MDTVQNPLNVVSARRSGHGGDRVRVLPSVGGGGSYFLKSVKNGRPEIKKSSQVGGLSRKSICGCWGRIRRPQSPTFWCSDPGTLRKP